MDQQLKKHIRRERVSTFISNSIINGGLAYLIVKNRHALPMFGEHAFSKDLVITGALLAGIITAIVVPIHRGKVRKGTLPVHRWEGRQITARVLAHLPRNILLLSLIFGLFGMLVFAPATIGVLRLLSITSFEPLPFAVFKGIWAGALAAILTRPLILLGMEATSEEPDPA